MISILILDDDANKIQRIVEEIKRMKGVSEKEDLDIKTCPDIIGAKKLMKDQRFDLLLLDIQIPNRFGQTPQRDGGLQLLHEILSGNMYEQPLYIVGITAYDDIFEEVSPLFAEKLWSIVKYDSGSINWVKQIGSKVRYLVDLKKGLRSPMRASYEFDLAIITALPGVEFESIKNLVQNWDRYEIANDGTSYYTGVFENERKKVRVVAASALEMGMVAISVLALKVIYNFCPRYLAIAGIAAGIRGRVNIGDIMVADPSWDYGSGKIAEVDGALVFSPDPRQIRLEADLKAKFQSFAQDRQCLDEIRNGWTADKPPYALNMHIGPIASGAAVVAHGNMAKMIADYNRNMIGLDMETYGVLYTAMNCPKPRPTSFSMKAVCDFADSEKGDTFQRYAAYTSAKALQRFTTDYL